MRCCLAAPLGCHNGGFRFPLSGQWHRYARGLSTFEPDVKPNSVATGPIYSEIINRAAITLLAMSFSPDLRTQLTKEITVAVRRRGGEIEGYWLAKYELRAVFEDVAERALAMLSVMLRERLPGIADEMDREFGDRLQNLLFSFTPLFPTL